MRPASSANNWWLRSVNDSTNFRNVNTNGSANNNNASNKNGVALGLGRTKGICRRSNRLRGENGPIIFF